MLSALIIVFREVLEAALVIGVVAAAVEGLPGRGRWVAAGVLAAAGLMLAWHSIWMAEHGREMTVRLKTLGVAIVSGRASVAMLIVVTALAVMREGSEIALFLYGVAASGVQGIQLLVGSVLGLACGAFTGFVLFAGLSRIPLKRLFQVSGVIILLIASGMVARAMELLVQAGYVPPLVPRLWDSSALLSGGSILGRSLAALVGYTPAPSLMQVLAWFSSFALIGGLMLARGERFVAKSAEAAG